MKRRSIFAAVSLLFTAGAIKAQAVDPRINQFRDRLASFIPYLLFETTQTAELALTGFVQGFGVHNYTIWDIQRDGGNIAVSFEPNSPFIHFKIKFT